MNLYPKIADITNTEVDVVPVTITLDKAMTMLFDSEHRYLLVTDDKAFYVIGIFELLDYAKRVDAHTTSLKNLTMKKTPTLFKHEIVSKALKTIAKGNDIVVVLDENATFYGIVTQVDILSSIDPDTMMETFRLSDLLKFKKRVRWVNKEMSTEEIVRFMEAFNHDVVMVVEERRPIGIVTIKDILKLIKRKVDLSLPIKNHMTTPVMTLSHTLTLKEALHFMQDKHFKRIVTVDENGFLSGIITLQELVSMAYTRWMKVVESYQNELRKINEELEKKNKKYEKYAGIDPLTGLYNRMKFLELYVSEYKLMLQRHNSLSLMVVDLDYFKRINDTYGHNVGDEVLKKVAKEMQRTFRNIDIVCRWGGEEFVVLLPAAEIKDAEKIAEKLRNKVKELRFDKCPCNISVSIGLTKIYEGDELYSVIERADKALYRAKHDGRDRVKLSL